MQQRAFPPRNHYMPQMKARQVPVINNIRRGGLPSLTRRAGRDMTSGTPLTNDLLS